MKNNKCSRKTIPDILFKLIYIGFGLLCLWLFVWFTTDIWDKYKMKATTTATTFKPTDSESKRLPCLGLTVQAPIKVIKICTPAKLAERAGAG